MLRGCTSRSCKYMPLPPIERIVIPTVASGSSQEIKVGLGSGQDTLGINMKFPWKQRWERPSMCSKQAIYAIHCNIFGPFEGVTLPN